MLQKKIYLLGQNTNNAADFKACLGYRRYEFYVVIRVKTREDNKEMLRITGEMQKVIW